MYYLTTEAVKKGINTKTRTVRLIGQLISIILFLKTCFVVSFTYRSIKSPDIFLISALEFMSYLSRNHGTVSLSANIKLNFGFYAFISCKLLLNNKNESFSFIIKNLNR